MLLLRYHRAYFRLIPQFAGKPTKEYDRSEKKDDKNVYDEVE